MKSSKKLLGLSLIILCVVALTGTTYSWIKRVWSPSFDADTINIEAAGSLVINLENRNEPLNRITLNDLLSATDFKLKQVSNATGHSEDFFTIDYGSGTGQEKLQHITRTTESFTELGQNYGYIEGTFFIVGLSSANANNKYVYLDYNSCIDNVGNYGDGYDPSEAIRISITVLDQTEKTYLIRKTCAQHMAASAKNASGTYARLDDTPVYAVNNALIYQKVNNSLVVDTNNCDIMQAIGVNDNDKEGKVCTLANFNGGYTCEEDVLNNVPFNTNKILFPLTSDNSVQITIRIWLEGYDYNCVDAIASSKIKVKLIFKSYDK